MRAILIVNLIARSSSRARFTQLQRVAAQRGHTLDIIMPATPEATTRAVTEALERGYDRICCAGGDGTVNRVATTLAGGDVPLGIIPTGTVNVLARELQLPLDPVQAMEIALTGPVRRLDLGLANGRPFTLMAGLGFDAEVVSTVIPRLKELFGSLAYVSAGMQVLTHYKSSLFHLDVDGVKLSLPAWLLVVGNASYYTYQLSLATEARMDDGLLDVCIFAESSALDRLTQISATFIGNHIRHENVRYFRTRSLRIDADPQVHLQLDGDPAGFSPAEITVCPAALPVVVPGGE